MVHSEMAASSAQAAVMGGTGGLKVFRHPAMLANAEHLGYTPRQFTLISALEGAGAASSIAGLWQALGTAVATGRAQLSLQAVVAHSREGASIVKAVAAGLCGLGCRRDRPDGDAVTAVGKPAGAPVVQWSTAEDPTQLKQAFGRFPSGVAAVCADVEPQATGLLVSSFTSVSLDPPLVSICIQHGSRTWASLRTVENLGVSLLGDTHEELCRQFSAPPSQRLAGIEITRMPRGAVLLPEATAWFVCSVYDELPAGDHTIVLLHIEKLSTHMASAPLIFHGSRFHRLSA
ncbi:flavin reductase [Nocardia sp. NPDC005745]|uniref:flavin reductase n=1 Tax=Nocardia sp. NPDC005745 TaxID=3157061 RepID=UPI0033EE1D39